MDETVMIFLRYILLFSVMIAVIFPFFVQDKIYYPSKQLFVVDLSYEDVFLTTEDGVKINAWYSAPQDGKFTVVFCHGNGGNLSFYKELIETLQGWGYGVLAVDYRGYGKSEGKPSEEGLYEDLRTAVNYLEEKRGTSRENIVLWGLSLGGAVVAQIASENDQFRGVVLQSTFTSIKDISSKIVHKTYLGIKSDHKRLFSHKIMTSLPTFQHFDTKNKVDKIKSPLLIGHAEPDNLIPVEMGLELGKINPEARVFISKTGGHNDYDWFYPTLHEFLNSLERVKN